MKALESGLARTRRFAPRDREGEVEEREKNIESRLENRPRGEYDSIFPTRPLKGRRASISSAQVRETIPERAADPLVPMTPASFADTAGACTS